MRRREDANGREEEKERLAWDTDVSPVSRMNRLSLRVPSRPSRLRVLPGQVRQNRGSTRWRLCRLPVHLLQQFTPLNPPAACADGGDGGFVTLMTAPRRRRRKR